jgi:hypothetical protein
MRRLLGTLALAALCLQPGAAGQAPAPPDVSRAGPQVGEVVPDFRLTDQSGRLLTRQSIMGTRGAMLVFFRSADW